MEVTLTFADDEQREAQRALSANKLCAVVHNLREELQDAGKGKAGATYWLKRLNDLLLDYGIDMSEVWS